MNTFEEIKTTLLDLARSRNVPITSIYQDWSLDYKKNGDATFMSDVLALSELMRVHREAIEKGDLLTACCALIEAQGFAHNLSTFFFSMKEDIFRVTDEDFNRTGNPGLDWPPLPQHYKYPTQYGYQAAERMVTFGQENYRWDTAGKCWIQVT